MKLLFDQNLSRHLVRTLADEFPDSRHVTDVELDTATDHDLWRWAGEHDHVIVSKDSDFRQLAFLHGPPPKIIWLRLGNVSTTRIADVLRTHREVIERFVAAEGDALLVIPHA